jgi:hypothetical protein
MALLVAAGLLCLGSRDVLAQNAGGRVSRSEAKGKTDQYANLSDLPGQPRTLRSANFVLHTDLSDRSAKELLDKLETMLGLIVQYYRRSPSAPIELYVVRAIDQWPAGTFPPEAQLKIREPAGVTLSRTSLQQRGRRLRVRGAQAVAYACDNHGVAQHESVHAICHLTFGSTGPSWYAEGMAEMGRYWKKGQRAVDIDPVVVKYLTTAEPKRMLAIVNPAQPPGTWQDYAWRWALCHMLEFNPNYHGRFKALGMALMQGKDIRFEQVYGEMAREISFEYDFFIKHLGNGFRADLCAWNWKAKYRFLRPKQKKKVKVSAKLGWQPTGVLVHAGEALSFVADGTWKTTADAAALDADGDGESGHGKLVGVLMHDDQLSAPFDLGQQANWTSPEKGAVYLRCQDSWTEIGDNKGTMSVVIARAN